MKRQWIATGLAIFTFGWLATPAIAQVNMKNGYLNTQMREALCLQDWAKAIRVVDEMKRISPGDRQELNFFRARLVILRNRNARVASWPAASYCSGESDNPEASTEKTPQAEANQKDSIPVLSPETAPSPLPSYGGDPDQTGFP